MEKITSNQNRQVKAWTKLKTKHGREKAGQFILEGWHLVSEAIHYDQPIMTIITTQERLDSDGDAFVDQYECVLVSDEVAKHIGDTKTPQGIFAIVEITDPKQTAANYARGGWLLLDQIQDPGNIGTMVRTADAMGLSGVVFGRGTASQYSPKVSRAMQGSQFHIQIAEADLVGWVNEYHEQGFPVYGTELNPAAVSLDQVAPQSDFALIMGNEGNGMQATLLAMTDANLFIPMKGNAESLNVAIAASIVMFHLQK
ncbi:RNA methyltransferase [Lactobacillus sp. Sy-1]|uniref:TrmH family RNA methyltransferase n=1 Tax=Lactobacillus sp. Sy-1 TaxID=2109645 RepID=UPI001C58D4B4|nr:RNA methyltransferase [Lactobacillus sp. Sy-1]MBW1605680.1 RNA methyltransferase [Lactobacillus sp. Sy-1]